MPPKHWPARGRGGGGSTCGGSRPFLRGCDGVEWEFETECASFAWPGRRRTHVAAVGRNDGLADVEPKTASFEAPRGGGAIELLEHPCGLVRSEADATIAYGHLDLAPRGAHAHVHAAAVGAVLDRVLDQVLEDLAQTGHVPVALQGRRTVDVDDVSIGEELRLFGHLMHQGDKVRPTAVEIDAPALD